MVIQFADHLEAIALPPADDMRQFTAGDGLQPAHAGSVAIAGRQTGIYPLATPGGWQLIGRTSAVLFDATLTPPTLLRPGDNVRFVPQPEGIC